MYDVLPSFVLGFHGCDVAVAEAVFAGGTALKRSRNRYDWLGSGVYFWENSPARALEYAQLLASGNRRKTTIKNPAVIGAVIDLGRCLNLLDAASIAIVKDGYKQLRRSFKNLGQEMPQSRTPGGSNELLLRYRDRAVIEFVHRLRVRDGQAPFDSVRGVFVEGDPLYESAGFHEKSHVQVCVRNMRCIKGYFRVLPAPRKR